MSVLVSIGMLTKMWQGICRNPVMYALKLVSIST